MVLRTQLYICSTENSVAYSNSLRAEFVALAVTDALRKDMQLRIRCGKGKQERQLNNVMPSVIPKNGDCCVLKQIRMARRFHKILQIEIDKMAEDLANNPHGPFDCLEQPTFVAARHFYAQGQPN